MGSGISGLFWSGIPKQETLCAARCSTAQHSTYSGAIAVPNPCDLLDVQSLAQVLDDLLDDRIHGIWQVLREPGRKIEFPVIELVSGEGITVQDIRDDSEESTRGEAVSNQLGVLVDAEDVAEDDDGLFG